MNSSADDATLASSLGRHVRQLAFFGSSHRQELRRAIARNSDESNGSDISLRYCSLM